MTDPEAKPPVTVTEAEPDETVHTACWLAPEPEIVQPIPENPTPKL